MAELEEYIALLITYISYKQDNPDAPITSLGLEKMALKEFDKGPLNIEAPLNNDVNITEEGDTEDDMITNAKDLYKRFENLVTKDQISIGSYNNSMSKGASLLKNSKLD